jgi:hypothetical protein
MGIFVIVGVLPGCAPSVEEMIRAPLHETTAVSPSIQSIPLALVELALVPQEIPKGTEMHLISFPDEYIVDRGDVGCCRFG